MVERHTGRIDIEGKGRLKVTVNGIEKVLTEKAAPREIVDHGNPDKKKKAEFPEGTIESLRTLLREVSGSDNTENADGYWMGIDKMVSLTPQTAINKLKRAGVGHLETARMLIQSDPLINLGLAHHNFSQEEVDVKISELATLLLPLFQNVTPKRK